MVSSTWLPTLALLALTIPIVKGQQNTCTAGEDGQRGAECIRRPGTSFASAFCSSFLPITTPVQTSTTTVIDTVTRNVTSFTATTTEIASPPATATSSETATFSSTVTETTFSTVVTGTTTSFVDTTTTQVTSYSNVYTCPGDPASSSSSSSGASSSSSRPISSSSSSRTLSFPTASKNATTEGSQNPTGTIGTAVSSSRVYSGSLPYYTWSRSSSCTASSSLVPPYYPTPDPPPPYITAPYDGFGKEKRQVFGRPRCLRRLDVNSGRAGVSDACNCLDIATPTPSQTIETVVDPSTTSTITNIIRTESTFTSTPTITVTQSVNRSTLIATDFVTSTTSAATIVPETLTITRTSVSVITGPSPNPSTFNIYYTLNSTEPANFFQAGPAPGGSGIVLANERQADFFTVDGMSRLVDVTAGRLFMAKNTEDLYPFALLQTTADVSNTPVCEACGGRLECDFPGTTGNVFALCYGFLALGPRGVFGLDADENGEVDCVVVDLLFK